MFVLQQEHHLHPDNQVETLFVNDQARICTATCVVYTNHTNGFNVSFTTSVRMNLDFVDKTGPQTIQPQQL